MNGLWHVGPTEMFPVPVWRMPALWDGEVAVIATGPSVTRAAVDDLRGVPCVVVKGIHEVAPWADALVANDAGWWRGNPAALRFDGLKICAQDTAPEGVYVFPIAHEKARLGPAHVVEIRSSGLMAIRVAVAGGARRVRLLGFDGGPTRWDGGVRPPDAPAPAAKALEGLVEELRATGIEVSRA